MVTPDLPSLKKITGSQTVSSVDAGASKDATVTLSSNYVIVGVPEVSTDTENADVVLISGGKNSFKVRATNNAGSAQDIVVDYTVYVIADI